MISAEKADPDADQAGVRCRMGRPIEWEHNKLMYHRPHTPKHPNNCVGTLVAGCRDGGTFGEGYFGGRGACGSGRVSEQFVVRMLLGWMV